ncbi:uncharacterized protein LOC141857543 [Brevipalpus obovatus]|uniref:uncharacterized protein LOC141857543 n=1 Tax=Brevipalpus obovatus TaxID=246614 RepID=UPI003D9EFC72
MSLNHLLFGDQNSFFKCDISPEEYESLQAICMEFRTNLMYLERTLWNFEFKPKLSSLSNKRSALEVSDKAWLRPSIRRLRDMIAALSKMMSTMHASLAGKESHSDFHKCTSDELKYFANEWTLLFRQEVQNLLEQNEFEGSPAEEDNILKLNVIKLEEAMREKDELIKHLQSKVFEAPKTVLYADELTGRTLNIGINVESGFTPKDPCVRFCGLSLCILFFACFAGLLGAFYILYVRFFEEQQ